MAEKKSRRKILSGEESVEVIQRDGREIVSEEISNQPVTPPDDEFGAEVEAQFSRTLNTGEFTSVRIGAIIRVPCKANPKAIDKRMGWAEDFVMGRVGEIASQYE